MSAATNVIKGSLDMSDMCINSYLEDMSDADLMIRPVPGANHMAWQLGHLIVSENNLVGMVAPGAMPALPPGFAEKYTKDTAAIDDPKAFHTKDVYLRLMKEQRAGVLAALAKVSDADLERQAPEKIREYCPTVGATFAMVGPHWMMHSGQWVIVRRKLGRKAMF